MKKPLMLFLLILPGIFVLVATANNIASNKSRSIKYSDKTEANNIKAFYFSLYNELHLKEAGLNQRAFNTALDGFQKLDSANILRKDGIITIIDFSQPSSNKRLYVLDLENKEILFNTLVAHGKNSGTLWTRSFSNKSSSHMSSYGFFLTAETYLGDNGYSLRLDGQEQNINDNARKRSIVMHGASYVDPFAINKKGYIGRSWGCPAVPVSKFKDIINTIKEGTCLFIYNPDPSYLKNSPLLNQS